MANDRLSRPANRTLVFFVCLLVLAFLAWFVLHEINASRRDSMQAETEVEIGPASEPSPTTSGDNRLPIYASRAHTSDTISRRLTVTVTSGAAQLIVATSSDEREVSLNLIDPNAVYVPGLLDVVNDALGDDAAAQDAIGLTPAQEAQLKALGETTSTDDIENDRDRIMRLYDAALASFGPKSAAAEQTLLDVMKAAGAQHIEAARLEKTAQEKRVREVLTPAQLAAAAKRILEMADQPEPATRPAGFAHAQHIVIKAGRLEMTVEIDEANNREFTYALADGDPDVDLVALAERLVSKASLQQATGVTAAELAQVNAIVTAPTPDLVDENEGRDLAAAFDHYFRAASPDGPEKLLTTVRAASDRVVPAFDEAMHARALKITELLGLNRLKKLTSADDAERPRGLRF